MRRAVILLLFALPAYAAPPIPYSDGRAAKPCVAAGETVTVPAGGYADISIDVPAGASVIWRFSSPPVQRSSGLTPGRVIFAGSGTVVVTAIVVDFDKKLVSDVDVVVRFGGPEPAPKPKPVPPKPPTPKPPEPKPPEPAPIPDAGFRVLIVYEASDATKYPRGQVNFMNSTSLEAYCRMKCPVVNGQPERRIWDKDTDTANAAKVWQDALKRATTKATSYPWIIVSNGKTGYEGPLPYNPTDHTDLSPGLNLLKKYGGE